MNDQNQAEGEDKEFLEYILKKIVSNPADVVVERTLDPMGILLTVRVHSDDMGSIIGKEGRTAKALRSLLRIIGTKSQANINMKIENPEDSE